MLSLHGWLVFENNRRCLKMSWNWVHGKQTDFELTTPSFDLVRQ
jgi:hypothetical protein